MSSHSHEPGRFVDLLCRADCSRSRSNLSSHSTGFSGSLVTGSTSRGVRGAAIAALSNDARDIELESYDRDPSRGDATE
jgi:hypothetical protein